MVSPSVNSGQALSNPFFVRSAALCENIHVFLCVLCGSAREASTKKSRLPGRDYDPVMTAVGILYAVPAAEKILELTEVEIEAVFNSSSNCERRSLCISRSATRYERRKRGMGRLLFS